MIETKIVIENGKNDKNIVHFDRDGVNAVITPDNIEYEYEGYPKNSIPYSRIIITAEDDGIEFEDPVDLLRYCGIEELKTNELIQLVTANIRDLLLYKNKKYGDSALKPIQVFASDTADVSITIRMDDKLSRIINSSNLSEPERKIFTNLFSRVLRDNLALRKNDIADLSGYLILLACSKGWIDYDDQKD